MNIGRVKNECTQDIKNSIKKCAKYNAIADEENTKIRDWLEELGFEEDDTILNRLIDSVEIACNPNEFIKFLESYDS